MESQKVKENRRAKFLAKMENKNKANKEEKKKQKLDLKTKSINEKNVNNQAQQPSNIQSNKSDNSTIEQKKQNPTNNINDNIQANKSENSSYTQKEKNKINNPGENINNLNLNKFINSFNSINNLINQNLNNNNVNNSLKNNDINNNKNTTPSTQKQNNDIGKINFNEILEKSQQYDYMISYQSFLKKILIIILAIIHCLSYRPLDDNNTLKYTLIVLELSSLFFNKYYNDQKKQLTKNNLYENNMNNQSPDKIDKLSQLIMKNFAIFNHIFVIVKFIKDIIADISILFIINIIFFLMNKIKSN